MQFDLPMLIFAGLWIAIAVAIAVVTGTLAARLIFHASGLKADDVAAHGDKPL